MAVSDKLPPLAITCGDPAGIGPEVIEKLIHSNPLYRDDCVLIGSHPWTERLSKDYAIRSLPVGSQDFSVSLGEPTNEGALIALESMKLAAQGCIDELFRGVVTGPVSKYWLKHAGFAFPGQTEFFASAWGGEPTMSFVGKQLRVVLATWHIPLREVPSALNEACIEKAVQRANELAQLLGSSKPRIGVCGLNPHAGEDGLLGREEQDVINPVLDKLRESIPGLSSCLPGDTVFHRQINGDFDVVIAAYHDQGLSAVKTLEFDSAVNLTLGLPHIRTSPDHGTAFDLAGKKSANTDSFAAAINLAQQLTQ